MNETFSIWYNDFISANSNLSQKQIAEAAWNESERHQQRALIEQEHKIEIDDINKAHEEEIDELNATIEELRGTYKLNLKKQRASVSGDDVAKFCPFGLPYTSLYNSRDVVHIGDTMDYLLFNGRVNDDITEVVFQEMKTAKDNLNKRQKSLRECIINKKVRWETWFLDDTIGLWKII